MFGYFLDWLCLYNIDKLWKFLVKIYTEGIHNRYALKIEKKLIAFLETKIKTVLTEGHFP